MESNTMQKATVSKCHLGRKTSLNKACSFRKSFVEPFPRPTHALTYAVKQGWVHSPAQDNVPSNSERAELTLTKEFL